MIALINTLLQEYNESHDLRLGPLLLIWFNFNPSMDK